VPDFRGNHTKSSRTGGSFVAALTDQVAGSKTNSSARNMVGCSEGMVVILWNELLGILCIVVYNVFKKYNNIRNSPIF